jgi:hypothetical protein
VAEKALVVGTRTMSSPAVDCLTTVPKKWEK